MVDLATYIPAEVSVLVAGIIPLEGFVDDSFISVTKDVRPFTSQKTVDGIVSRVYNNDQTYTIDITIYSGSSSNTLLTKLWQIDEISQRGKFPLLIKDGSGSDLFFSTNTWIEGIPSLVKSNDYEHRTWTLKSSQAVINLGSNHGEAGLLEDLLNVSISALPILQGLL